MKHGIVLGSNELSKLIYAGMEAVTRTSLNDEVSVFLTMDAVKAFTKNPEVQELGESSKAAKNDNRTYLDFFRMARKTGRAKVYACSYISGLFKLNKDLYNEEVDEVLGITSFLLSVDGQMTSIW